MDPIVIGIESLRALTCAALQKGGMLSGSDALIIADHLVDSELRGLEQGGVRRAITIAKRLEVSTSAGTMQITGEAISSALVDGGGSPGYLVGHKATTIAVQKAARSGLAMVAATNTWATGMLSYYAEMATRENMVFFGFASSGWRVAPFGGSQPRFGTNPICIGFPSPGVPVIVDAATSAVAVGQVLQQLQEGRPLDEGCAVDADGQPTTDPAKALAGALNAWGGVRGAALALAVQLIGLLAGGPVEPDPENDASLTVIVASPGLFGSATEYAGKVAAYSDIIRQTRTAGASPRMPFERSAALRQDRLALGKLPVSAATCAELERLSCGSA